MDSPRALSTWCGTATRPSSANCTVGIVNLVSGGSDQILASVVQHNNEAISYHIFSNICEIGKMVSSGAAQSFANVVRHSITVIPNDISSSLGGRVARHSITAISCDISHNIVGIVVNLESGGRNQESCQRGAKQQRGRLLQNQQPRRHGKIGIS